MGNWLLGLVIFWGLLFLLQIFSKPVNRGMTDEDYKKMKKEWEEEDREKEIFDDYIEAEVDVQRMKRDENSKRINSSNDSIVEFDSDLPFNP